MTRLASGRRVPCRDTARAVVLSAVLGAVAGGVAPHAEAGTLKCAPDSVKVGTVCVDRYEASVWHIPGNEKGLLNRLQKGKVTLAELQATPDVWQVGCPYPPFNFEGFGLNFPSNGNWIPVGAARTPDHYAVSIPGVLPTTCLTWFQAEQACRTAGKRLLTNQEWQAAAAGTPDHSAICNVAPSGGPEPTGNDALCVSTWGSFDMVGNVGELVADWVPMSRVCGSWGTWSDDLLCDFIFPDGFPAPSGDMQPGALVRGGKWSADRAGVFAVGSFYASYGVRSLSPDIGFRCGR